MRDDFTPDDALKPGAELCDGDCAALEALCEAGFDCSKVAPEMRARAERAARVLGLLSGVDAVAAGVDEQLLIDVTCAQVARARRQMDMELSPRDEDALEALVCAGMDASKCPASLRERAMHQAALLSALDVQVTEVQRATLVSATLARVQNSANDQDSRMRLADQPGRIPIKFRWSDLVSVAALLLIGTAVLTPMLGAVRSFKQRSACDGNMSAAGLAFGQYFADNRDSPPLATDSPAGSAWWFVGDPKRSNSANAYTMSREGYIAPKGLACDGNPNAFRDESKPGIYDWGSLEQISYSYQNMFTPARTHWAKNNRMVLLADRSPVIPRAVRGEMINPVENSLNHAGAGQTALFSDGTTKWLRTPVLKNGDNIWLPKELEDRIARLQNPNLAAPLKGTESPEGDDDVFLGP